MKIIRLALLLSVATLVAAQTTKYEAPAFSASYPTPSVDSKGVTFDIKDVTFTDSSVVGQKGQTGRYVLLTEKETAAFVVTYTDAPFEQIGAEWIRGGELARFLNDRQVPGALAEPLRKEFHLTDSQLGLLGSAFIWLYAIVGLPLGRLADRRPRL